MGGISGDHSTKIKAQNRVKLYKVTAEFMTALVGNDGRIFRDPSPLWLKASMRAAEEAEHDARVNKAFGKMVGRRQPVAPPLAPLSSPKITWKRSIGLVKGVFSQGL